MNSEELINTAIKMTAGDKGLLAIDETYRQRRRLYIIEPSAVELRVGANTMTKWKSRSIPL